MNLKKGLLGVLILFLILTGVFAGGQKEKGTAAAPAAKKLVVWYWGEQEAPGAQKWLEETAKMYSEKNPGITFELVLQSTDNLVPAFKTAASAKQGPDIQYFWGGVWTLEDAWAGSLAPISDFIPQSEYSHYISNVERESGGKLWGMGWYLSGNSMAYRKDLFKKAGLDPEGDYVQWDKFLAACEKLKAAGITPIAGGLKDGWFGGWIWQLLGKQGLDSAEDFKKASVGQYKFTDPRFAEWWSRLNELIQKGYWNSDINSLDYQQGQDLFVKGEAAMIFGNDTFYPGWMDTVGSDNFGVMMVPVWGKGKMASAYTVTAQGLGITSWSKYKQEAADFLMYMHTADRLAAWWNYTGVFPADDRFDASKVTSPQMKKVFTWIKESPAPNLENFVPSMLDDQAHFVGCQQLFAGELTPAQCAELQETVIQKWRKENPEAVDDFTKWIK
ncbi:MAG: extracellular solute-binding protein [Spirochaetales bacterium]|nr:MAG: extracellular solute-binding protein [Spirochaetales bacterium]